MHKNLALPLALPLALLLGLILPNQAWAYSSSQTQYQTSTGQDWTFTFSGLPLCISGNLSVEVTLFGDYNSSSEVADIYIESISQGTQQSGNQCEFPVSQTYTLSCSYVNDGVVTVLVNNSSSVNTGLCSGYGSVALSYTDNFAPVASAVATSTNEDTPVTITLNATDADGDALTYSIVGSPSTGTLGSVSGASVTYTPDLNTNVTDTFTYKANDGTVDSNTATVTVTVYAVDDPPVAVNSSASLDEDTTETITLGTTTDVDGTTLTYSIVSTPSYGTLGSVSGTSVDYTPNADYYGSDSFTFKSNDGTTDSNTATLSLTINSVNDPPSNVDAGGDQSGNEGDTFSFTGSATDVDGSIASYTWNWGDSSAGAGTASATHVFPLGYGVYTVILTATDDSGLSTSDHVDVTVNNLAPVIGPYGVYVDGGSWGDDDDSAGDDDDSAGDDDDSAGDDDDSAGDDDDSTGDDDDSATPVADYQVDEGTTFDIQLDVTDLSTVTVTWDMDEDGGTDITGNPTTYAYSDDGFWTVTATADDGDDQTTASATIEVQNVAPTFTSTPVTTSTQDLAYSYTPSTSDPGADTPSFTVATTPSVSMTIDSATGALSWTPTYLDTTYSPVQVTLVVSDGDGGEDVQSFPLTVAFTDADADGMADDWETAVGLNPADGDDGTADDDNDGMTNLEEFENGGLPGFFDGPSVPVISYPTAAGTVDSATPALEVENSNDGQSDTLTYDFEVFADEAMTTSLSDNSTAVDEDSSGYTEWTVEATLTEHATVWWRARACDPWVCSDWSAISSFFVNAINEAPPAPTLVSPIDGATADSLTPTLTWTSVTDPDGDVVTYDVEVYDSTDTMVTSGVDLADSGEANTTWVVDTDLSEDAHYSWTVIAYDEEPTASTTPEAEDFFVSTADGAPTGVAFTAPGPVEGSAIDSTSPVFYATEGTDPEGTALTYSFEADSANTFDTAALLSGTADASGAGTVVWDLAAAALTLPAGTVYARVRATDEGGIQSEYDTITFTVGAAGDDDDSAGGDDDDDDNSTGGDDDDSAGLAEAIAAACDCGSDGGASLVSNSTAPKWAFLLLLLPLLRRRRRA